MPSWHPILSWNWAIEVYTPHPLRQSRKPTVRRIHFADVTDWRNWTIDYEIQLLRAGAFHVANAHGLGYGPDALDHFIIYPLCSQATLMMPNLHCVRCLLADSNHGIFSPEADLQYWYLDCIRLCNNWFQQPDDSTVHIRFSAVVNDWVVDIKCLLL